MKTIVQRLVEAHLGGLAMVYVKSKRVQYCNLWHAACNKSVLFLLNL